MVLVFGLFGYFSGAIRQATHWLGLALAYVAARPLAARATPAAAPALGLSPSIVNVLLSALFFAVLLIAGTLIFRALAAKVFGERLNGRGDRAFGFALGAAKGSALLYLLLSLLVFFEKPLTKALGAPPAAIADSRLVGLARRHDLFHAVPLPALAKVQKLLDASRGPDGLKGLENEPELRRLLDDPQFKAALQDGALSQALRSGDLSALRNDPRLKALLDDPRLASPSAAAPAGSEP